MRSSTQAHTDSHVFAFAGLQVAQGGRHTRATQENHRGPCGRAEAIPGDEARTCIGTGTSEAGSCIFRGRSSFRLEHVPVQSVEPDSLVYTIVVRATTIQCAGGVECGNASICVRLQHHSGQPGHILRVADENIGTRLGGSNHSDPR